MDNYKKNEMITTVSLIIILVTIIYFFDSIADRVWNISPLFSIFLWVSSILAAWTNVVKLISIIQKED